MNILLVSESFIVKDSLGHLFNDIFNHADIMTVSSLDDLDYNDLSKFNFAFVDANIGNINLINKINDIKVEFKKLKIMILDARKDKELFFRLVKLGVDGYIVNISDKEEFVYIVKKILNNKKFYDSELLQYTMTKDTNNTNTKLTSRENCVLDYVCKGLSNKDIAENLSVTDYTIKKHVSSILTKLNLKSRQEIIVYARKKAEAKSE